MILTEERLKKLEEQGRAKAQKLEAQKKELIKPVLSEHRHPQRDFFVADIYDLASNFWSDTASLEFPLFAMKATKNIRTYERGDVKFTIMPCAENGSPTQTDMDIWIFVISKLMTSINKNEPINPIIRFTAYDYLISTNRPTTKQYYNQLKTSLFRMVSSSIRTSFNWDKRYKNKPTVERAFNFLEGASIIYDKYRRMQAIEVVLPQWLYEGVQKRSVLKLSPDYFRIQSPLHRRIYEIARKHCGNQQFFEISLDLLQSKTGSTSPKKLFKLYIKRLSESNELPDYSLLLEGEKVTFKLK